MKASPENLTLEAVLPPDRSVRARFARWLAKQDEAIDMLFGYGALNARQCVIATINLVVTRTKDDKLMAAGLEWYRAGECMPHKKGDVLQGQLTVLPGDPLFRLIFQDQGEREWYAAI